VTPVPPWTPFSAIWDTGATGCVITDGVVKACNLHPVGIARVSGVHGDADSEVFLVNIRLPNNVAMASVSVTKGQLPAGTDVLIGMNVITAGDFAITNRNGKTLFSFRTPSLHDVDYVAEQNGGGPPQSIPSTVNRAARRHPPRKGR